MIRYCHLYPPFSGAYPTRFTFLVHRPLALSRALEKL